MTEVLEHPFLIQYLTPLREWLDKPNVSEICVNRTGGFWVEQAGAMHYVEAPALTQDTLRNIAQLLAGQTKQSISESKPLLSTSLPTGERVQITMPPASPHGITLTIRKQVIHDLSLESYAPLGALSGVNTISGAVARTTDTELDSYFRKQDILGFIRHAIRGRKNIILSGGTSSGKTTMLNAMLKTIDEQERIITIEDTAELTPPQKNWVSLTASRGGQGIAKITMQDLLEASLRMRPDRILLGELRGREAFTFLRAINTGHPGSITTIHADHPTAALQQLTLMVQQDNPALSHNHIMRYISSVIDIIIQLGRTSEGMRKVTDIWYPVDYNNQ